MSARSLGQHRKKQYRWRSILDYQREQDYLDEQSEEQNAKQILHEVLNELYYSKSKKKL
jgi:hypothetical protein